MLAHWKALQRTNTAEGAHGGQAKQVSALKVKLTVDLVHVLGGPRATCYITLICMTPRSWQTWPFGHHLYASHMHMRL